MRYGLGVKKKKCARAWFGDLSWFEDSWRLTFGGPCYIWRTCLYFGGLCYIWRLGLCCARFWLMSWRVCYIWRWLLLVDVLETLLHLDVTFGDLLYIWSMMLGCCARFWRLTLEDWHLTWSTSWVGSWETLSTCFDYAWEVMMTRVDDVAVIRWWSDGWMSSSSGSYSTSF